jgi:hypothetical protein
VRCDFKGYERRPFTDAFCSASRSKKALTGDGKIDLVGHRFDNASPDVTGIYILPNDGSGSFNAFNSRITI